jgi:hypothetical protein
MRALSLLLTTLVTLAASSAQAQVVSPRTALKLVRGTGQLARRHPMSQRARLGRAVVASTVVKVLRGSVPTPAGYRRVSPGRPVIRVEGGLVNVYTRGARRPYAALTLGDFVKVSLPGDISSPTRLDRTRYIRTMQSGTRRSTEVVDTRGHGKGIYRLLESHDLVTGRGSGEVLNRGKESRYTF